MEPWWVWILWPLSVLAIGYALRQTGYAKGRKDADKQKQLKEQGGE